MLPTVWAEIKMLKFCQNTHKVRRHSVSGDHEVKRQRPKTVNFRQLSAFFGINCIFSDFLRHLSVPLWNFVSSLFRVLISSSDSSFNCKSLRFTTFIFTCMHKNIACSTSLVHSSLSPASVSNNVIFYFLFWILHKFVKSPKSRVKICSIQMFLNLKTFP